MSNHGTPESQAFGLVVSPRTIYYDDAKTNAEVLKQMDPFRTAELALEVQLERMHVIEAMNARDAVVQRLADAYDMINQKNDAIENFKREYGARCARLLSPSGTRPDNGEESEKRKLYEHIAKLEGVVKNLQEDLKFWRSTGSGDARSPSDPPPHYEEGRMHHFKDSFDQPTQLPISPYMASRDIPIVVSHASTVCPTPPLIESPDPLKLLGDNSTELDNKVIYSTKEPEARAKARHAILASLPLPPDIPDDALKPISIPTPFTLHEFLGNASGSLRNSLSNYRIFQQLTTSWCPEREEHGYMLAPVFKCSTNPRVATAHRWSAVDIMAGMNKPTECFYNKDGKWYYAGIYKAFQLEDLTVREWEALSHETAQLIIKDTIAGRKNTSPQNVYETTQLYAAGALRVACIGLQCVGFNNPMYRAILELASKCSQNGKWRAGGSAGSGLGLGTGAAWNATATANANANVGGGAVVDRSRDGIGIANGNENIPSDRFQTSAR